MKTNIETYVRLKPPINLNEDEITAYTISNNKSVLDIYLPEDHKKYYINNNKKTYSFKFTNIFDTNTSQDEVFNKIGPALIKNALQGYNNTVFCYGQTGSGKTYTMSGNKLWKDRGLTPRFIIDLFKTIKALEKEVAYDIYVSYLEIYNENAYDLLDTGSSDMDKWKKILVYEDNTSNIIMKNLNTIKISNEKQALDIFMTGNYNRQVGSTPMNMASSRSHAIFTLLIEGRAINSEKIISSKINLVDLAGSERLNKLPSFKDSSFNISSSYSHLLDIPTINETKYINLSLSFLEQVIIALNERSTSNRVHIPYRNSLMTTILKDSLGGNCKTILIANCSVDYYNLDETISTLRFALRCARIENEVTVNEHMDLNLLISKLNAENEELRKKLLNANVNTSVITENNTFNVLPTSNITFDEHRTLGLREKDECKMLINEYINKRTSSINTKDINQLYFIIDYLIDYINNKEKIYKEKLSMISNSVIKPDSTNLTFNNDKGISSKSNDATDSVINHKDIKVKGISNAGDFIEEYKKYRYSSESDKLDLRDVMTVSSKVNPDSSLDNLVLFTNTKEKAKKAVKFN